MTVGLYVADRRARRSWPRPGRAACRGCVAAAVAVVMILLVGAGCASSRSSSAPEAVWVEQESPFVFGSAMLHGVLTLPVGRGPHPAAVIVAGSGGTAGEARAGTASTYLTSVAHHLASQGLASLRYDPPGTGGSTGEVAIDTLDGRRDEALAALRALRVHTDVRTDRVGLWGESQGGWVVALAAAAAPDEVGFLITVSGSGVSVAEQQVFSIESQSRAAGMTAQNVEKAVLVGRLLIDWQLDVPIYRVENQAASNDLGAGPWDEFAAIVYDDTLEPATSLSHGIAVLRSIEDERWATYLYLRQLYLPALERLTPEQLPAVRAAMAGDLLRDPREALVAVRCPVLAVFGEVDVLQPTAVSAARYRQHLSEAGNDDVTVVIIAGVGHDIDPSIPDYANAVAKWLERW